MSLPMNGRASTYSDKFVDQETANGDIYTHGGFTAALLPRSNWNALPLGTKVKLTYMGRCVVVKIDDRGKGADNPRTHVNNDPTRILDLSRAAMAHLTGISVYGITDQNSGVIDLDRIEVVPSNTPVGPWTGK